VNESDLGARLLVRVAVSAAVLLAIFTLTFFLMRAAPGGPFQAMQGMPPEVRANLEHRFGLDLPVAQQYFGLLSGYVTLDFGPSMTFSPGKPVSTILAESFPVSLELGLWALVLAIMLGVTLGTVAGLSPGSAADRSVSAVATIIVSISIIVIAALFRKVFIVDMKLFPPGGFTESAAGRVLPVATLALAYGAIFARLVRGGVASAVSGKTWTAVVGRGVPRRLVVLRYVLPSALIPMLEYLGSVTAGLLTGSFVVETLFEVPGIAVCFVQGAAGRDYTLVSAAIMVYAALLIGLNLVCETLHSMLDPRGKA